MIRFRNPGSNFSAQIRIFRQLYLKLHTRESFTLDDIKSVLTQNGDMTAYGYSGENAISSSNTKNKSKNSTSMNAKLYAEVFRMLGWMVPYYDDKEYPLVFTEIGRCIAIAESDESRRRLCEQCVLGINFPTQLASKTSYDEKCRLFKCALRFIIDLDGVINKYELCLGPMSTDDEDEAKYQEKITFIKSLRGDASKLDSAFKSLADSLNMKEVSVDNCTRIPVSYLKFFNWVESVDDGALYGSKQKYRNYLRITERGKDAYNSIKDMYDLRLEKFCDLGDDAQKSMIRLGTCSMLDRAGYDISKHKEVLSNDKQQCSGILNGKELLFSPYQTIRRPLVEEALNVIYENNEANYLNDENECDDASCNLHEQLREQVVNSQIVHIWNLNKSVHVNEDVLNTCDDRDFLNRVDLYKSQGCTSLEIVNKLFVYYTNSKKDEFYELIATLFRILGYDCVASRGGDNGSRWDAIIKDPEKSIPIEIKSPAEEKYLSIKAIRQALENKIVLLSRKTHKTKPEVSSLAVGYYAPNKRAEVDSLISAFKSTYGFKIGVIDFKSLLSAAVSVIVDGKGFETEKLYDLEGIMYASIT